MNRGRSFASGKSRDLSSFSLIELLTVIAIISILAALTLYAYHGVLASSLRSRARTEVGGLSAALESFKSDNGAYPQASSFGSTNSYATAPGVAGGLYQLSSQVLYQNLTGQTNYGDAPGTKSYFAFKRSQLGNNAAGAGQIYIEDPFANAYGYFTGSGMNLPYNGTNLFDLWSTGGDVTGTTNAMWINNWGG